MTQEKIDHPTHLPEEKISEVFGYLDEKSQSSLALTNKMFGHSVFQQDRIKTKLLHYMAKGKFEKLVMLLAIRPDLRLDIRPFVEKALSKLAGFAEQDNMEIILKIYPEFFYTYAPLKDISNIYPIINKVGCKGITVFQHAVWAGDVRYMCNMMLDCLPKNEDGEKIRVELLRQYNELMDYGVVYDLESKRHVEKQFSLQSLLGGLSQYVTNYEGWTWEERELHWCKDVGLLQPLLTAHFRHHYCDPEESFWNTPSFTKAKLIRSLEFYNYVEGKKQLWDDSLGGLGSNFGIVGLVAGRGAAWWWAAGGNCGGGARGDLRALTALCEVRTKTDLPVLIKRLQSPVQSPEEDREHLCVIS